MEFILTLPFTFSSELVRETLNIAQKTSIMSTTYYTHPIGSLNRLSIILVCFHRLLFVFRFGLECRQPSHTPPYLVPCN